MAHQNGWDESQHPRNPAGTFTHKPPRPEHPDIALAPEGPAVDTGAETLDTALDAVKNDWFLVRERFADAIQASIPHRVCALFPDATGVDLEGGYHEDDSRSLKIRGVFGPDGGLIASVDHDQDRSDRDGELIDELTESELADDLEWLPEIQPEDWMSSEPIRIDFADLADVIARVHPAESCSDPGCGVPTCVASTPAS